MAWARFRVAALLAALLLAGCSNGSPTDPGADASTPPPFRTCNAPAPHLVDTDGDGVEDREGDESLLAVYLDGDATMDFVVDANDSGRADLGETIHHGIRHACSSPVGFSADVNGDSVGDAEVDTSGDGAPDWALPEGLGVGLRLVITDVTGDGMADWTYDSSGQNGRPDAYYDPVCKCTGALPGRR